MSKTNDVEAPNSLARKEQKITLNCDMGEAYGAWRMGQDELLMPYIDCANIACGFHAGDPSVMRRTLLLAKQHSVEVGAHTGFPDMQGFGRRTMHLQESELRDCVHYQIAALVGLADIVDIAVSYVKPHGAMYNQMMQDDAMMTVLMRAVADFPRSLDLMIQSTDRNAKYLTMAEQFQLKLRFEAFSDRRYQDNGALTPRTEPGAVLSHEQAVEQSQHLLQKGAVVTLTGKELQLQVDTICIHGDNSNALAIVQGIGRR